MPSWFGFTLGIKCLGKEPISRISILYPRHTYGDHLPPSGNLGTFLIWTLWLQRTCPMLSIFTHFDIFTRPLDRLHICKKYGVWEPAISVLSTRIFFWNHIFGYNRQDLIDCSDQHISYRWKSPLISSWHLQTYKIWLVQQVLNEFQRELLSSFWRLTWEPRLENTKLCKTSDNLYIVK